MEKETKMKKLLALVLGLSVMCSVAAFAQEAGEQVQAQPTKQQVEPR